MHRMEDTEVKEYEMFCEIAVTRADVEKYAARHKVPDEDPSYVLGEILETLRAAAPRGNTVTCSDAVEGLYIFTVGLISPATRCAEKTAAKYPEITFIQREIDNTSVTISALAGGKYLEDSVLMYDIPGFGDFRNEF